MSKARSPQCRPLKRIVSDLLFFGHVPYILSTLGGLISEFCIIGERPKYNEMSLSQKKQLQNKRLRISISSVDRCPAPAYLLPSTHIPISSMRRKAMPLYNQACVRLPLPHCWALNKSKAWTVGTLLFPCCTSWNKSLMAFFENIAPLSNGASNELIPGSARHHRTECASTAFNSACEKYEPPVFMSPALIYQHSNGLQVAITHEKTLVYIQS